ncbi:MAG TPA: hypothetical protein VGQ64_03145, partial [Candidatus Limnocylindrales bacterium]|nr:hypothetical protein [Candidatus Limnocylindrales bacterium]
QAKDARKQAENNTHCIDPGDCVNGGGHESAQDHPESDHRQQLGGSRESGQKALPSQSYLRCPIRSTDLTEKVGRDRPLLF